MPHDPLALFLHVGDAFAALFRHAPAFEARLTGRSWAVGTGEAHCIWNWVGVTDASPTNLAGLHAFAAACRERRVEGLVCYPLALEGALARTIDELGLGEPGVIPLMACDHGDVPPLEPPGPARSDAERVPVERVVDPATLAETVALMTDCFEVPPGQPERGLPPAVLAEPAAALYAARRGGAVAGMLALTRFGGTVSIDLMAVHPASQRRGIGRALMLHAMHEQIAAGATAFHLLSTPEGQRLYELVGFTTLMETATRLIPLDPAPPHPGERSPA